MQFILRFKNNEHSRKNFAKKCCVFNFKILKFLSLVASLRLKINSFSFSLSFYFKEKKFLRLGDLKL